MPSSLVVLEKRSHDLYYTWSQKGTCHYPPYLGRLLKQSAKWRLRVNQRIK
jgi:hypothetical protein